MLITTATSVCDEQTNPLPTVTAKSSSNLRDHYVRASISGNSRAAELGRYLNINETTFQSAPTETDSKTSCDESSVHEHSLAPILEVSTSSFNDTFDYVRIPEPQGGVQEWWTRILSGSVYNSQTASGCPAIGESL